VGTYDGPVLQWDLTFEGRAPGQPKQFGPKEPDKLWTDLAADDAHTGYRAIWTLAAAREKAVGMLKERLQPTPASDLQRAQKLIDQLNDEQFVVREAACKELRSYGTMIQPVLRQALTAKPPAEATRRLESLLADLRRLNPEELRTLRAIQVLERIGSPEARQVLATLAEGAPLARPTVDAKAALERLDRCQADRR